MTVSDLGVVIRGIAPAVKAYTAEAVDGFALRLKALEDRPVPLDGERGAEGPTGPQGATGGVGPQGPEGSAGKDADLALVEALRVQIKALELQVEALKTAPAVEVPDFEGMVKTAVAQAMSQVHELAVKAVAEIPRPADGRSVTVDDVAPLIVAEVTKAVAALPPAKDGIGLTGTLVDRDGHLIVTLSDGGTKDVGLVVGKDVDMAVVSSRITEEVAKLPRPADGAPGRDGSLENLKVAFDGRRTVSFCFKDGTPIEGGTMVVGWPLYDFDDPIWRADKAYVQGDQAVWGGSTYLARTDSVGVKPGTPDPASRAWVLVVKRGQDGKDGKDGAQGLNGKDGKPGRDGRYS